MTRNDIKLEMLSIYPRTEEAIVDFALEMVRRHNEQCAKIIDGNHAGEYYQDSLRRFLSMKIREAKP